MRLPLYKGYVPPFRVLDYRVSLHLAVGDNLEDGLCLGVNHGTVKNAGVERGEKEGDHIWICGIRDVWQRAINRRLRWTTAERRVRGRVSLSAFRPAAERMVKAHSEESMNVRLADG